MAASVAPQQKVSDVVSKYRAAKVRIPIVLQLVTDFHTAIPRLNAV